MLRDDAGREQRDKPLLALNIINQDFGIIYKVIELLTGLRRSTMCKIFSLEMTLIQFEISLEESKQIHGILLGGYCSQVGKGYGQCTNVTALGRVENE
jgi:hypothetical protein